MKTSFAISNAWTRATAAGTLGSRLRAALIVIGLLGSTPAIAVDSFTDTYRNGSSCGSTYDITGREPTAAGKYPVFLYMVGTSETYTNNAAMQAIIGMANRGYVAATIQYPNSTFGGCSTIGGRAQCIFNASSANSAVAKLCARAKADCGKGIVVGGFSQGSIIATLAKNYDGRVQAAWGTGTHTQYSVYNLDSCMLNGNHTLPGDRLRIVSGERDNFAGGNANAVRSEAEQVTGLSCGSTAFSCFRSNGSGWYIVRNSEVQDGSADHCYMRASGDCNGNQNNLDSGWQSGAGAWGLNANLDWLTNFTAR